MPFTFWEIFMASMLVLSSLGVISSKKPVHSALFFLLTLLSLASLYLELSAEFIAAVQVLVYAGAILVIFMFVIVLFQDAHGQLLLYPGKSVKVFILSVTFLFGAGMWMLGSHLLKLQFSPLPLFEGFGTVEKLGNTLYIDFFFPFEAVIFLFLIALIGALYIAKKKVTGEPETPKLS
jgi:NADH-quinone oxidoreductase subunit J